MFDKLKKVFGKRGVEPEPPAPPPDATLAERMLWRAQVQAHRARSETQTDVPFSLAGLAKVEAAIDGDSGRYSETTLQMLCEGWGAVVGEVLRGRYGGAWEEIAEWGPVIDGLGGVKGLVGLPVQMVEIKYRDRQSLRLMTIFRDMQKRIDEEKPFAAYLSEPDTTVTQFVMGLRAKGPAELLAIAAEGAARFAAFWRARKGEAIGASPEVGPLLEDLLAQNRFVLALKVRTLVDMGCFLGEILRRVVGGGYAFEPSMGTLMLTAGAATTKPVDAVFTTYRRRKPVGELPAYIDSFLSSAKGRFGV